MTDPIRAALERLIARLDETTDPSGPVPAWSDSFYAARAALAQSAPPAEGDVTDAELNAMWNCSGIADEYGNHTGNIFEFARAAIALDRTRRAPVLKEKGICPACEGSPTAANNPCAVCGCSAAPPAEGEVGELVEWLRQTGDLIQPSHLAEHQRYKRAADLLSQRHSAPVPSRLRTWTAVASAASCSISAGTPCSTTKTRVRRAASSGQSAAVATVAVGPLTSPPGRPAAPAPAPAGTAGR